MGFNAFGTRLQSLWIMFFFARKDIPCGVKNRMLNSYDFHFFLQHVTLTYVSAGFCQIECTFSTFTSTFQRLNNKVANHTACLPRLVCAFVVEMQLP